MAKKEKQEVVQLESLEVSSLTVTLIGRSPFICNSMSLKVKKNLLCPPPKMNQVEKAVNIKHDPYQEYNDSVYRGPDDGPTRIVFPCPAIKAAMATAALELPGIQKSSVKRLVWVEGTKFNVYGVPQLYMDVIRCADINRTPDVRTRAALTRWCADITVSFTKPQMTDKMVLGLISTSGVIVGIGDFRQEKGAGNNGQFYLPSSAEDTKVIAQIKKEGGTKQQDAALREPTFYDDQSEQLYHWMYAELERRGRSAETKEKGTRPEIKKPFAGRGRKRVAKAMDK